MRNNSYPLYLTKFLEWFEYHQYIPSISEMTKVIAVASKKTAHIFVKKMQDDGLIQIGPQGYVASIQLLGVDYYPDEFVPAGFPRPGEDSIKFKVDFNDLIVKQAHSTLMINIKGSSMEYKHIVSGDMVVVDKSLSAHEEDIVLAWIDGGATLKTFKQDIQGLRYLQGSAPEYSAIYPTEELKILGVVTFVIRDLKKI